MNKPFLRFPSGRSVSQVKKDAKKLKKELGVDLQMALDVASKHNGLDMPWAMAMRHLSCTAHQTTIYKEPDLYAERWGVIKSKHLCLECRSWPTVVGIVGFPTFSERHEEFDVWEDFELDYIFSVI